ncbi:TrkA C-terminal domain-containing protein [Halovenus halobia]|uniref:TrkA C-terminal domain-containing protein n=1 Tax=Halovenus halobia TaxID=3396622 RepID=UPI003F57914C
MTVVLSTVATVESGASIITQLLGIAAMAVVPAALASLAYRAAAEDRIPPWLAIAAGVAVVALYLGMTPALAVLFDETVPSKLSTTLFNVGALVLAVGGAAVGREVGDRFGAEVLVWHPTQNPGQGVSQLAQAVGQVTTVSLPATIEDAPGYDPVPRRTKTELAGSEFVFPRGLTVEELEDRLTEQLRSDYGIGVADIRFDEYGDLESLAVGTRAAGIGATLPPATNAVAVRADPGFSASTGDVVQVWEPDSMQRVCTGELRGVADDVVTIAIDAADTPKVDPTRRYRLVTLPVDDRPDREFASLLRAAEETFSTATIEAGSPLHGQPVGALDLTLIAIRPEPGDPVPFPDSEYRLAPGDLLFVIATPGNLRRLESGATALDPAIASAPALSADESDPAEGIQTADPTATAREEPTGADGLPAGESDDEPAAEPTADDEPAAEPTTAEDSATNAGSESFQEIKTNVEESDPAEQADTAEAATDGDSASFDELKSEFESGDTGWEDDAGESAAEPTSSETDDSADADFPESDEIEIAFADEEDTESEAPDGDSDDTGDDLVSLDEAEISFDDDADDDANEERDDAEDELDGIDIDDDLQGDAEDAVSDDIGDLEFEDNTEDVSDLDLSDDEGPFAVDEGDDDQVDADDDDEADEEEDDEADDDSSSGGGSSFAQLKEEFESGDADWEDDVSDSPGGDMRLDE